MTALPLSLERRVSETRGEMRTEAVALEAIYRAHAGFVWRTLRRLGLSEADASDASQDVFLAVHRSQGSFEGRCAMTTWLYTICKSVVRDGRRRAFRRYEVAEDALEDLDAIESGEAVQTPFAATEERQRFGVLLRILNDLDDSQREVFALFELEGVRGEEISEMLAIPVPTVHSRLRLARQAFEKACNRFQAGQRFVDGLVGATR